MNYQEFKTEMNRLKENWKNSYSDVLAELIWKEFQYIFADDFSWAVTTAISEMKHAPLLPEFRILMARRREQRLARDKAQHANDAKDFYKRTLSSEDEHFMFRQIGRILSGDMSEAEQVEFKKICVDIANN